MKALVPIAALLLAGCAWFEPPPAPRPSAGGDEQRVADLESCKQQARAVLARDAAIDQDIGPADSAGRDIDDAGLGQNLDQFSTEIRYRRIVDSCMRGRGHLPGPGS